MAKKENTPKKEKVLTVTKLDYTRLTRLIQDMRGNKAIDPKYLSYLGLELQKADVVDSIKITPEFVTMNSVMDVEFLQSGRKMELRLVYPKEADFPKGLISVLSPLGCALLGYKAGDIIEFEAPAGVQKVHIEKVVYQPEANGEDLF